MAFPAISLYIFNALKPIPVAVNAILAIGAISQIVLC